MYYNTERSHQGGYRNTGRRPIETIESYLKSVNRDGAPSIMQTQTREQPITTSNMSAHIFCLMDDKMTNAP